MDVRDATREDVEGIRAVARSSMRASYAPTLDEDVIDDAVDRWYSAETVRETLTDSLSHLVVAVDSGEVVGFAEGYVENRRDPAGRVDWVHVDPDRRGEGIGHQLLKRIETLLLDADVRFVEGAVLAANERGGEFYEEEGYEQVDEREVEIGDETFVELVYTKAVGEDVGQVVTEARRTEAGDRVYVAFDESARGSKGPFFVTYLDPEREERYGWLCGNCDGMDVAMDSMERIECNECGNRRKPVRWDAVYL
jgi:ribosomal protein S18 acetylase RimI-like enzyme